MFSGFSLFYPRILVVIRAESVTRDFTFSSFLAEARNFSPRKVPDSFQNVPYIYHRGNSIEKIKGCRKRKLGVEIDVRVGVDGVPFVFHDKKVLLGPSATKLKTKNVESFSHRALSKKKLFLLRGRNNCVPVPGIPSLGRILRNAPKVPLLIDLKTEGVKAARDVADVLRQRADTRAEAVVIVRDLEVALALKKAWPEVNICWCLRGIGVHHFTNMVNHEQFTGDSVLKLFQAVSFPASFILSKKIVQYVDFLRTLGLYIFGYRVSSMSKVIKCRNENVIPVYRCKHLRLGI